MELKNADGLTEKEFLEQYRPGDYEHPSVTVDMLIFAVDSKDEGVDLLLIRRKNHPCIGKWAIPGGFVEMNESLEEAAARENRAGGFVSGTAFRLGRCEKGSKNKGHLCILYVCGSERPA